MSKIFFYSPNGFAPLKTLRHLLHESHGWTWADTSKPPFPIWGVAVPRTGVDAAELVDALTKEGVVVLPSLHDSSPIPAEAASALAEHGVLPTDTAHDAATKMHSKSGMPVLRPHLY